MPTVLPRIQVTKTEPVAAALEVAAQRWPGVPRSEQVARLLAAGAQAITQAQQERRDARRRALEASRARIGYPPRYLEELRSEWPE